MCSVRPMESSAVGPSNSIESSDSGPSTSSSSGPAAFDSSKTQARGFPGAQPRSWRSSRFIIEQAKIT